MVVVCGKYYVITELCITVKHVTVYFFLVIVGRFTSWLYLKYSVTFTLLKYFRNVGYSGIILVHYSLIFQNIKYLLFFRHR